MPFSLVQDLEEYWSEFPPIQEAILMLAAAYTDWQPDSKRNTTPEEAIEAVQKLGGEARPISDLPEWMRVSMENWQNQPKERVN